ncbi:MAG: hypothetical protein QXI33_02805 [Candidatus Pacearchaeota archaeon]
MANKSPVYSKIEYENALSSRKNALQMQINLLNIIRNIGEYKDLRKKEFIRKIKIKSLLKEIKEKIKEIESKVPKSEELKLVEKFNKKNYAKEITTKEEKKEMKEAEKLKEKKRKKEYSIESELEEIKRKLEEIG